MEHYYVPDLPLGIESLEPRRARCELLKVGALVLSGMIWTRFGSFHVAESPMI
jgi:hypothetical protein